MARLMIRLRPSPLRTAPRISRHAPSILALVAVVCAAVAPPLSAQSDCDDVSGAYDVLVNLPGGGPTNIRLELEQTACELTGIVGLQTRNPIQDGTVDGSTAAFSFEAQNQGDGSMLRIHWEISIDGDEVTGTFSNDLFGSIPVSGSRVGG